MNSRQRRQEVYRYAPAGTRPHGDAARFEVAEVRENRLKLLDRIRAATQNVADFSRIDG